MKTILSAAFAALAVAGMNLPHPASAAEEFPNKQIRFVVPYPPGGANDTVARVVAQKLSENMGQAVVVDNKPGASGMIAGEFVARSAPDGYTVMIDQSSLVMNPGLHPNAKFDVKQDLAPVTLAANMLHVLIVNPTVPARDLAELIALAKAQPGKLNYSSTGTGGPQHILMELFKRAAGVNIVHIPYKGGAPATLAVLSNDAQMTFITVSTSLPHIKAGKVRVLAAVGKARSKILPEVPTFEEMGFKGLATPWLGILAPAKTPAPIIKRLNAEFVAALNSPQVRDKLEQQAFEVVASTPEAFARFIDDELALYGKLIRDVGIKAD